MKYRYRVLAFLFVLSMITYIDRVSIGTLGSRIRHDLGIGLDAWGWIIGAFALSYALFEIPTGAMGDRWGSRATLSRIVLWWSVFTSATGAVNSFTTLAICRFLFGAGEAGAYPNIAATLSRWFPLAERARATGIILMASRLGGAVTPILVLLLAERLGWRGTFAVCGAVGALWVAAWYVWFRDDPRDKPGVPQSEIDEIGYRHATVHHRLPWRLVLRNSNYWTLLAMYHCYGWGSFFYLGWLTDYLRNGRGFTDADLKAYGWLPFVFGACGNVVGGWLSDSLVKRYGLRIGRCTVGAAGMVLSGVCMACSRLVGGHLDALLLLSLGYFCMDAMLPVAWAVVLDIARKHAGAVGGSMNMAGQVAGFLSSVAFGHVVNWSLGRGMSSPEAFNFPLLPFSVMLVIGGVLFSRLHPERQLVPAAMADESIKSREVQSDLAR